MNTRIMGLDVGRVRIGVALSDLLGITAQPYEVIKNKGRAGKDAFERIRQLATERNVTKIVIGLPRNMNGTLGPQAEQVQRFGDRIKEILPEVEVSFWDERLTSKASEDILIQAGMRRERRKEHIDKIAAALILQGFLDFGNRSVGESIDDV